MRPSLHPLSSFKVMRHALIWLLLMVCMVSLAQPFGAHASLAVPAYSSNTLPDAPLPEPDQRLCSELLAESGTPQAEHDLPGPLPVWLILHTPRVPHKAIAASGLHVPDPLLGRYQANAPPRA